MKGSTLRIGNWVLDESGKPFRINAEGVNIAHNTPEKSWPFKPIKLSVEWLNYFNWPCDRPANKKTDTDGLWILHGITLYQSSYDQKVFNYATYVRGDGEFKGGFGIEYVHQLQNLVDALTNGHYDLTVVHTNLV